MSDLTQASKPAQTGADDNNNKSDGSTGTKSKSAIKRDKRRKAQARAHASHDLANTTVNKPTLSTFIGQDPDLASLDYTADVAVHYGHFKKEISRHASTIHPLLGTVIDSGDEKKALAALDKRSNMQRPTPKAVMTEPQDIIAEQERYDFELWEYLSLIHI